MKEKLPKSWAVLNDGHYSFLCIPEYMNKHDKARANWLGAYAGKYYGIGKDGEYKASNNSKDFEKILTLQEFIELTKL